MDTYIVNLYGTWVRSWWAFGAEERGARAEAQDDIQYVLQEWRYIDTEKPGKLSITLYKQRGGKGQVDRYGEQEYIFRGTFKVIGMEVLAWDPWAALSAGKEVVEQLMSYMCHAPEIAYT